MPSTPPNAAGRARTTWLAVAGLVALLALVLWAATAPYVGAPVECVDGTCPPVADAARAGLFDTSSFPPRWNCGQWAAPLGWLHIASDATIWLSYTIIPFILAWILHRRGDVPFSGVVLLFVSFIVACGIGHLLDAMMFWWPGYRLLGAWKAVTAAISLFSAIVVARLTPLLLGLRGPEQVRREIDEKTASLRAAMERIEEVSRAKDVFLANMSHELRTPIHGIMSYANFGIDRADRADPEKLRGYFEQIERSGGNLLEIVNEVLDSAALESGTFTIEPSEHDLADLVSGGVDEVRSLTASRSLSIRCRAADGVRALIDGARIRQVLRNILANAIRFSPDGGTITLNLERHGDRARVAVDDDGPGIDDDMLETVFDRFHTTNEGGGTGLGLTISRQLVEAHGGRVWAERRAEGGTRIQFELPALD